MFSYVLHHADVKSLQQSHTSGKTFLKVYLATHSTLGDGTNLCTNAVALGQFVDALGLDKCRVHVEADESAHSTEHVVTLEGKVYLHFLRQVHELRLHLLTVDRFATQ